MGFLKVRSIEEINTSDKEEEVKDGKILEIQEAHRRLQEAMDVENPIIPHQKLETKGTEKSPLNLGSMTRVQATRKIKHTGSSPVTASVGGEVGGEVISQEGLSGGSCRVFHPYISRETRPSIPALNYIPSPASPYNFEMDTPSIHSKDFAYLVKWCQNRTIAGNMKTVRGVQRNKLSYDSRADRLIAPNRLFEATLLLSIFDGNTSRYNECRQLCKFLYSATLWEFDTLVGYPDAAPDSIGNVRFSNDITAFLKLSPFCQSLFIQVQYFYSDFTGKALTGQSYWFRNGFDLREILTGGIASSTYCFNGDNCKDILFVTLVEFSQMSLHGQIIILRNAVYLKDNIIYVALNTQNDLGKFGRQYSTLTELSKLDRALIVSLQGYDMEAAMQTIMVHLVPKAKVPFFRRYIVEKKIVRKEISILMNWSIEQTKEILQAIVMGQGKKKYSNKLEENYQIYTERDMLAKALVAMALDNTLVAQYAKRRTIIKHAPTKVSFKKMGAAQIRSYMFFYWTYYERKIQDVMCSMFTNPLPLHDAVYSQVDLPNMKDVEKKIKEVTGIDMKLGEE